MQLYRDDLDNCCIKTEDLTVLQSKAKKKITQVCELIDFGEWNAILIGCCSISGLVFSVFLCETWHPWVVNL